MIKFSDLHVGDVLKHDTSRDLTYVVEAIDIKAEWLVVTWKDYPKSGQTGRALLQKVDSAYYAVVKPKHKVYICLLKRSDGYVMSASTTNPKAHATDKLMAGVIGVTEIEVEEGTGI